MKEDFALIIGINDYTPPNMSGLKTLNGAINDANRVEEWTVSNTGGNVPIANIKKIISNPNPLRPLQDEIDDAFLEIEQSIKLKGGKARRLYFYFAGHGLGTMDSTTDTALCLANWSEYRRQSALSSESYKDFIKQYGYFEEIIFIADCCRNTKINIKPKNPTFSAPIPSPIAGETKIFVAYATQYQDQSFEIESADSELRGAFTTVLLEGLKGAAANHGFIGVDDLRDYLKNKTPVLAQQRGYKQKPDVSHNFSNNTSLITFANTQTKLNITFNLSRINKVELLDGQLDIIGSFDAGQNKDIQILLSKGLYKLRDTVTEEEIPIEVSPSKNNINVTF